MIPYKKNSPPVEKIIGPLYVVGSGLGILLMTSAVAWIYEKTRRRLEHPVLGQLVFNGESWQGLRPHHKAGGVAVRIELPGDKSGPDSEAVERFLKLWSAIEPTLANLLPVALDEFAELWSELDEKSRAELNAEMGQDLGDRISPEAFTALWSLSSVTLQDESQDETPRWQWSLEFDVAWDIEHTRVAFLDLDHGLVNYGLSCAF